MLIFYERALSLKKIVSLLVVLFVALSFPAAAAGKVYSVKIPKGYVFAESDGKKNKLAERFGMSAEEMEKYFSENGVLFLAVGENSGEQISLSETETDFSKHAATFSRMNDSELTDIENQLAGTAFSAGGIAECSNGIKFLRLKLLEASDTVTENYITVCSGKLYTLRITTAGDIGALSDKIMNGLTLKDYASEENGASGGFYTLLAAAGIAFFAALAVWLGYTIIRDIRSKKNKKTGDEMPD